MKKLLLSLVVLIAALSLTACSESTGVSFEDEGLTEEQNVLVYGRTYKVIDGTPIPFNSVEVFLWEKNYEQPIQVTVSRDPGGYPGYFIFSVPASMRIMWLTANKGGFAGSTGLFMPEEDHWFDLMLYPSGIGDI